MSNSKRRKKVRVGFEVEKRIGRWAAKRSVECRAGKEWLVRASERMSENSGSDGLERGGVRPIVMGNKEFLRLAEG